MLAAAALIAAGAPDAAAVPCSTRHLTLFEIYDTAALVAVASVSNAPRPMTSGAVDLDIVEQLKGAPVEHARAKENGSCTAGFYNVRTGKLARTALVFVGTDGHAVGYWSGVVEQPTPEVLDAIRAWRDAGSDPGKRTAALVAAIESPDQELSADAAYYLADEPALLRALDTAQLDRIWAKAGGAQWGPEIILARRRGPQLIALRSARALPRDLAALTGFDFEATWRAVPSDALLTIIYTSGTTGAPKGVEITHTNMMFELRSFVAAGRSYTDSRVISFLPHAHIADRMATHYLAMSMGTTVTACPDPRQLFEHVPDAKPTEFTGVPRVWEKLKAALEARFAGEAPERKAAIKGALEASLAKVRLEQAGQPVPEALAMGVGRAEQMMFAPLRAALGLDQSRGFYVGAAPTPREVLEFFHALGMPITEVWGMSELSCVATTMPQGRIKIGTVGKAMPGVELRIADDGEVLVRGPLVMRGYRNLPQQTAETIDADGWLHTGDIGALDDEGFLKIVDRKKEILINAAGKNMSPSNIEARLKTSSPIIGQAVVIGDARPYNVALLVLDPDGAAAFAKAHGLDPSPAALVAAPEVQAELDRAMASANSHLSRVEQIKRHALLTAEWMPGGDELTPTMKLRRKPIAQKYAAQIEALYAGGGEPAE